MASALVEGMLRAGYCAPQDILVINRHPEALQAGTQKSGIRLAASTKALVQESDVIILGTKPTESLQLLREVRQYLDSKLLISVATGITLDRLQDSAGHRARLVRAVPNTPSLVRHGATAYALGDNATANDATIVEKIFSAVGIAYRVRENSLDAVTGLSGSGPAYVFTFIEALADGGVMMGLPRDVAFDMAVQTVLGSAQLLTHSGAEPEALRDQVTSPKGTTFAGLERMKARDFRGLIKETVLAATARSEELSKDS